MGFAGGLSEKVKTKEAGWAMWTSEKRHIRQRGIVGAKALRQEYI